MGQPETLYQSKVFLSCKREKEYTRELVLDQHALSHIVTGIFSITDARATYTFHPGQTVIVPRNLPLRVAKIPAADEPFRSVSIYYSAGMLQQFYAAHPVNTTPHQPANFMAIPSHPLLESVFNSLLPYFELEDGLPNGLAELKIQESLTVLNNVAPQAGQLLGSLQEPGKVDLVSFMDQHFMYNLPLEKFAYLTGRSLTTFKKDFKTVFKDTPGRWLTAKRLELAHYQLSIQKRKPSDIYLDAGFENFSHFSFAFKKKFGHSPANL
ncbi:hypothetical protein A4H97_08750 [Niastella yeongjuensis]|uniref:HTH araC/xylS-type domain-containing protein n=1 Tax=Niastella yeongjuensis TaxID=354355 RepID=A0A1V9EE85_9BACT|nr:AraC family transcriptional regulator [Niastella yeongjuensis]OQP44457.1 hypothetical protein A4H97_08750 [Niastella yeongjuensis]SEO87049.1 transcriptional regulator, AraC family [Niastella yeongjuensis]